MVPTIQVTFDCSDPAGLAGFWAEVLGYIEQPPPEGFASWDAFLDSIDVPEEQRDSAFAIIDPEGHRPRLFFQRVPESKTAKNRVHLDVNAGGGFGVPLDERRRRVGEAVERAVALGATRGAVVERDDEYWVTLLDPEGNEFCIQ